MEGVAGQLGHVNQEGFNVPGDVDVKVVKQS